MGSGKAWPSLLQDAGGQVAEAGEPAALLQDLSPLGTIPAPSLAPLSPGNASISCGVCLVRLVVRVRTGKSCQHRPLTPWQEGTWLSSRAHVSMAHLPGTGFPTVTQGHDCTGALTSGKSNDKVKIELCSLGAGGPAEVLCLAQRAGHGPLLPSPTGGR